MRANEKNGNGAFIFEKFGLYLHKNSLAMDTTVCTKLERTAVIGTDAGRLFAWERIAQDSVCVVSKVSDRRLNRFLHRHVTELERMALENGLTYNDMVNGKSAQRMSDERIRYAYPWLKPDTVLPPLDSAALAGLLFDETMLEGLHPSLLVCVNEVYLIEFPERWTRRKLLRWWGEAMAEMSACRRREPEQWAMSLDYELESDDDESSSSDNGPSMTASEPEVGYSPGPSGPDSGARFSLSDPDDWTSMHDDLPSVIIRHGRIVPPPPTEKELIERELRKIEASIRELALQGVDRTLIELRIQQAFGQVEPRLSELHVTRELEIVLPDYQGMKIELRPIDKAVYLTFLSERDGINFKDIRDYKEDMWNWYRRLTNVNEKKAWETMERMMESDALSQSLRKIRLAFQGKFDDPLAKYYYVSGEQGKEKSVHLPAELVVWEEFQ